MLFVCVVCECDLGWLGVVWKGRLLVFCGGFCSKSWCYKMADVVLSGINFVFELGFFVDLGANASLFVFVLSCL